MLSPHFPLLVVFLRSIMADNQSIFGEFFKETFWSRPVNVEIERPHRNEKSAEGKQRDPGTHDCHEEWSQSLRLGRWKGELVVARARPATFATSVEKFGSRDDWEIRPAILQRSHGSINLVQYLDESHQTPAPHLLLAAAFKMTSHDVRDMLDLPGTSGPRPAKKQKSAVPKSTLKGLAREVQSLGGDNPIAIVPEVSVFKKRRLISRKPAAKWDFKPFKNSARHDGLVLRHWRKKAEGHQILDGENSPRDQADTRIPQEIDDSTFAKFNVRVNVSKYDDEQYKAHLQDEDWSKDETDYLMRLAEEYDLRWPVMWDRYEYEPLMPDVDGDGGTVIPVPKIRTMEDMKARYYKVAAAIITVHNPKENMNKAEYDMLDLYEKFDPRKETERKLFAEKAFHRTKEEAREEESLLIELKRILARSEKLSDERRELYTRLEAPSSSSSLGIQTSSQGLQQLLQQLMTIDKSKKRRSLMGGEGISPAPGGPGLLQQASFDRRDSSIRESISGPSGSSRKGAGQGLSERRQLTEDEEKMYGVSHPTDRLNSGPQFRNDRLTKPITTKSSTQQAKITNTLNELGLPPRLIMPTAETGILYESLIDAILKMLHNKTMSEKLSGEIDLAKAHKTARERAERIARGEPAEVDNDSEEQDQNQEIKMEDSERQKSAGPSARSASVHKRSASVLSTVSDKSAKRQKK